MPVLLDVSHCWSSLLFVDDVVVDSDVVHVLFLFCFVFCLFVCLGGFFLKFNFNFFFATGAE